MGQARSLPTGVDLRGYYEAALLYIDHRLPPDASLEEITAAASRRQAELARRPLGSVRVEMQELAEALLFVQRAHRQIKAARSGGAVIPTPVETAPPVRVLFEAEHSAAARGAADSVPQRAKYGFAPAETASQAFRPGDETPGLKTRLPVADQTSRRRLGDVAGNVALKPDPDRRPETIELPKSARPEPARLLEDLAWPHTAGLLLTLWQAWLALFSGWAVYRLLAWPAPGYGLDLSAWALTGVAALGVLVAAGMGLLARAYRLATHKLALLVHISAVACAADLLAWWLAARRWPGLVDYPGWGVASALIAGWLVAWGAALLHDARVKPPAKQKAHRKH